MGRKDEIIERVRAVAEPLAAQEGLELIDVQLGGSGRTELTLFIDKLPGGDAGGPAANMRAESDAPLEVTVPSAPLALQSIDDAETIEGSPIARSFHALARQGEPDAPPEPESAFAGEHAALAPLDAESHEGMEHSLLEVETPPPGFRRGVSLDDCANFSRIVSAALDVEDPLDGSYELVVSSPGLDRPLRLPAHYQRYAGKRVRVKTYAPVPACGNRKTFVGTLLGYDEEKHEVLIDVDGTHFAVPRQAISKANLDPVFDF